MVNIQNVKYIIMLCDYNMISVGPINNVSVWEIDFEACHVWFSMSFFYKKKEIEMFGFGPHLYDVIDLLAEERISLKPAI